MAIELGYPDPAAERDLLTGGDRRAQIPLLAPLADPVTLLAWQREAAMAHVAPALLDYVQALLAATRGNTGSGVDAGARRGLSPRAGLLLMAAARAWALLSGRPMVLPEDVQAVFPSVAGHRLAGGARAGVAASAGAAALGRRALAGAADPRVAADLVVMPAEASVSGTARGFRAAARGGWLCALPAAVLSRRSDRPRTGRSCAIAGSTSCPRAAARRSSRRS